MKSAKNQPVVLTDASSPSAASTTLTSEDLRTLKAAFPKDRLGVKVQSLNKDRTRALLVLYLQHTDVQDRLEEVDPAWTCEVISEDRAGDTVYVRSRMTLKGVSRENVGEGGDPKAAYSDALKRCAMLFGVGRYLYDSTTVWADYDESRDRFKQWSVDDYEEAQKRFEGKSARKATAKPLGPSKKEPLPPPAVTPAGLTTAATAASGGRAPKARPREELNRVLMNLYRPFLTHFPQTQFAELLKQRYGVGETRLMTVEQLEDLIGFMEQKLQAVA
jgi:hypothetical protein